MNPISKSLFKIILITAFFYQAFAQTESRINKDSSRNEVVDEATPPNTNTDSIDNFDLLDFDRDAKNTWAIASTIPVNAKIVIGARSVEVKGQSGLLFYTSPEALKQNLVMVDAVNLAFYNVDQALISGIKPKSKPTGVLAFSMMGSTRSQTFLKYDSREQTLSGDVTVNMNFPQVDELVPPKISKEDYYVSPGIPAHIHIQLKLEQPLDKLLTENQQKVNMSGQISVNFSGATLGDSKLRPFRSDLAINNQLLEVAHLLRFEVARRLCIQPVRILASATDPHPTGAGLAFGMPGANTQWNKADIVFNVRGWKSLINSSVKVVDNSTEESQIRAAVQDDDCIEVFFVENFNPVDTHGGGATWASGTGSSQIISSDGNATGGIDFTHLAHELGHVVALGHPDGSPGLVSGNSGTLMCPSGWHRDNPKINSQGNKDHSNNPLMTFAFKVKTANPDCTNDADCEPCPF